MTCLSVAQKITLKGSVIDKENLESLLGVHVYTSATNGTTTDIDGNFRLNVGQNDTVTFRMLGYDSYLLVVTDTSEKQDIIVQLTPGVIILKGVGITDYFQAKTLIKLPERKVFQVPGIRYPKAPSRYAYQYLGASFNPYYAAFTMSPKDYKQHKKLYKEYPDKIRNEDKAREAKDKMKEALEAIGDHLDDYYILDFIRFVGMTIDGVVNRSAYDLAKILPGEVDRYLEALSNQTEQK